MNILAGEPCTVQSGTGGALPGAPGTNEKQEQAQDKALRVSWNKELGSIPKNSCSFLWSQVTQEVLKEQTQTPHLSLPGTNGSVTLLNPCVINDTSLTPSGCTGH